MKTNQLTQSCVNLLAKAQGLGIAAVLKKKENYNKAYVVVS